MVSILSCLLDERKFLAVAAAYNEAMMIRYRAMAAGALQDVMRGGRPLGFSLRGGSMHPLLRDGDRITAVAVNPRRLRIGEIYVYKNASELIAHRLIRIAGDVCHLRGDASCDTELVRIDQLLGRVQDYERSGRKVRIDTAAARFAGLRNNYFHQCKRRLSRRLPRIYAALRAALHTLRS